MITFKQFITELFEKPYSFSSFGTLPSKKLFQWAYSDEIDMGDEEGDVANYKFKTDDGRTFVINFNYTVRPMKVICKIDFDDTGAEDEHLLTGKGDAMRILTTVLFTIQKELKRSKPDYVEFSSQKVEKEKKTGRTKLYGRMVRQFAGKMGYNLKSIVDHKYKNIFVLEKK
jgi:hypothetical protein